MKRLSLYRLDNDYIERLRTCDSGIYQNRDRRPYIGILVSVDSKCYFAPMTSPKPKHKNMRNALDFLKIENGDYGAISLSRMVPATPELASKIHIEDEPEQYRNLLQRQLRWIWDNQKRITDNAEKLYKLLMRDDEDALNPYEISIRARACDVRALETVLQDYLAEIKPENKLDGSDGTTEEDQT